MIDSEPIKIGLLFPMSGKFTLTGQECLEAAEAAVAIAEEDGLIKPGQVKLLKADVNSPESGAREAQRLIREGANILHGTVMSNWVPPAAEVAQENGILYWEAVAASEDIHKYNFRNFFRLNVSSKSYGEGMATFIGEALSPAWNRQIDSLNIATVSQADNFCQSVMEWFKIKAHEMQMRVVAEETVEQTQSDFGPIIDRVKSANTDVLVAATYSGPAPNLWLQAVNKNSVPLALIGIGAWFLGQYMGYLGKKVNGLYAAGSPHTASLKTSELQPDANRYLEKWKERLGKMHTDRSGADRDLVMIALRVLFEHVLPNAKSLELDDMREAILKVDVPIGGTFLGYGVKFTEDGHNERAFPAIMQWQDGKQVTVHPNSIATGNAWTTPLNLLISQTCSN